MALIRSLKEHVEAALLDAGLPLSERVSDGYRVSEALDGRVRVHWGFGQPFVGRRLLWPSSRLALANIRLAERGFCCQADERRDADGFYVRVDGNPLLEEMERRRHG